MGVGGCEFGFMVIDVSSSSLWRIHGEDRRERTVEREREQREQERGDETSTVCMCVCVCVT